MLPEQRWSAVRGSHRREFALCSALCISNTKTHALRSLFTFFFFFFFKFSVLMKERKQGGHMHRLRVREKLLLSMLGSHFL